MDNLDHITMILDHTADIAPLIFINKLFYRAVTTHPLFKFRKEIIQNQINNYVSHDSYRYNIINYCFDMRGAAQSSVHFDFKYFDHALRMAEFMHHDYRVLTKKAIRVARYSIIDHMIDYGRVRSDDVLLLRYTIKFGTYDTLPRFGRAVQPDNLYYLVKYAAKHNNRAALLYLLKLVIHPADSRITIL